MTLSIGCDHAGFELKETIKNYLTQKGISFTDNGTYSANSVDYPDFAHKVALDVVSKRCDLGILTCGSGNGVAITANKHKGVRAALCWTQEIAKLARQHNNANIIVLPARFITTDEAFRCLDSFLNTSFDGGRHESRVNKIEIC